MHNTYDANQPFLLVFRIAKLILFKIVFFTNEVSYVSILANLLFVITAK